MRKGLSFVSVVAVVGLLTLIGCNGAPGDSTEIKKLQADLKDANGQNEVLKKDAERLSDALKQAESALLETTDARNKLQIQVKDLTKSRDDLTATVSELGTARADLQKKVAGLTQSRDDLQKTVDGLTNARGVLEKQVADLNKARNVALEDAKNAQGKIEQLNNKLKVQTQQMTELQDQIVNVRTVLEHLQKNLQ